MGLTRDERCAVAVGEMAELGRFEVEFMVYGCAYLEDGTVKYRVSSREMAIHDFLREGVSHGLYPTPMRSRIERRLVPSGQRETIAQQVKRHLAKDLQKAYCPVYFNSLAVFAKEPPNNLAYDLLLGEQEALEGVFEEEVLQRFSGLVQQAYEGKVLTQASNDQFGQWLAKMRRQMEDDVIVKDILEKNLSGFIYEDQKGRQATFSHGQKEVVYRKRATLEAKGAFVTTIFTKTYWYDYSCNVRTIQNDFQNKLQKILEGDYLARVKAIKALPSPIDKADFRRAGAVIQTSCSQEAQEAWAQYGWRWGAK